ncbi:hypothetical protein ACQW02_08015 [Humitalea sp. 24SJ18S-53]|uniref:hypothetical protein n=1 Tax=Humitalea sp. 24SJ18S-53 TaxID=3422307 RepID=UPI003D674725
MLDLVASELFVVGALRAWVAPLVRPKGLYPEWRDIFRMAQVAPPGAVGFELLMSVVSSHAQRSIEVRCCHCPALAGDEAAMLRLVAGLQAGDSFSALDVLSDWLPVAMVAPGFRGAQRFAALTAEAGLRLPAQPLHLAPLPVARVLH